MVKIETGSPENPQKVLEVTRRDHAVLLEIKTAGEPLKSEVILLTPAESEALENALRIYRREAERRTR